MSTRPQLWTTEAEIDEDLADVDINLALGNYGQGQGVYDVGKSSILFMQKDVLVNAFTYLFQWYRRASHAR